MPTTFQHLLGPARTAGIEPQIANPAHERDSHRQRHRRPADPSYSCRGPETTTISPLAHQLFFALGGEIYPKTRFMGLDEDEIEKGSIKVPMARLKLGKLDTVDISFTGS